MTREGIQDKYVWWTSCLNGRRDAANLQQDGLKGNKNAGMEFPIVKLADALLPGYRIIVLYSQKAQRC
jgi:hypothetical protein